DVSGEKPVAAGDLRIARLAAAERPAFLEKFRAGCAVDGAVDPAAAQKRAVGRVHDGVDLKLRDVAGNHLHAGYHGHFDPLRLSWAPLTHRRCARGGRSASTAIFGPDRLGGQGICRGVSFACRGGRGTQARFILATPGFAVWPLGKWEAGRVVRAFSVCWWRGRRAPPALSPRYRSSRAAFYARL